jgi:protocatechuate 3,4-dioxygenase beta subunit
LQKEKAMPKTTKPTIALTATVEEGPYYKPGSPERTYITTPDTPGTKLTVTGRVFDQSGKPIAHAWLDFWHADSNGVYDNEGFKLRGHQYTDKSGQYRLETVRPRFYLFRAPHIHVKVRAAEGTPVLTTQLFFPGQKLNNTDPLFEPRTLLEVKEVPGGQEATFDFVVETG